MSPPEASIRAAICPAGRVGVPYVGSMGAKAGLGLGFDDASHPETGIKGHHRALMGFDQKNGHSVRKNDFFGLDHSLMGGGLDRQPRFPVCRGCGRSMKLLILPLVFEKG
jgi:hypothetical protein